jgi:SPP1 family predicted phage head-tail adaptor
MEAGKLRHRVTIQENQWTIRDAAGKEVDNWTDLWTGRVSIEPLSGREYYAAAQTQAEGMTRIRIRYPGFQVLPHMRVKWYDNKILKYRYYDIEGVIDQNERHIDVFLMTVETLTPP